MSQPLVLAIEPDLRQAAIVKRIVREKVLADVAVVDSRDAALEAMRTTIPDVLLLSALLSPRDEDELVAHLRTRRDAEHLQTHTIPQLASSIRGDDDERPKGLLSAFRRRKGSGSAPAGCDPDLFAEEIRTYLKRASERKREARSTGPAFDGVAPTAASRSTTMAAEPDAAAPDAPVASSWSSPFEWRPSRSTAPAPAVVAAAAAVATALEEPAAFEVHAVAPIESVLESPVLESRVFESPVVEPASVESPVPELAAVPLVVEPPAAVESPMFESPVFEPAAAEPLIAITIAPRPAVRYPLTMRRMKGWWFVESQEDPSPGEPVSEVRGILSHLSVPLMIASVTYADGCHIRRVRLAEA